MGSFQYFPYNAEELGVGGDAVHVAPHQKLWKYC